MTNNKKVSTFLYIALQQTALGVNVVVMFLIEQYLAGFIFISILLGDFLNNKNLKKTDKEINTDIAEAMAKKIVEDARMHRIARKSIEKNE